MEYSVPVVEFQFHYGTIKSGVFYVSPAPQELFQFHYGTIKSAGEYILSDVNWYFNSTMVRLKVGAKF